MNDSEPRAALRQDLSVPIAWAYLYMLLLVVPLTVALALAFVGIWGWERFFDGLGRFLEWPSLIPSLVIGVPLHEVLHGLGWVFFGKRSLKHLRFGVQWKVLTPYAHLRVPIRARAYRIGAALPALLLGLLPYLVGLAAGEGWFTALGLLYLFAAGGDLLVLWLLRKVDGKALVEDHPSRAGCYAYGTSHNGGGQGV
jgi:hypothetical protein